MWRVELHQFISMKNILLTIFIITSFFFCLEEKKEELKTYSINEFSIILIPKNMFGNLDYDLDVPLNVDRREFTTKFKYLELKNYRLNIRECGRGECYLQIRGVSPSQFRSARPEDSILFQSKDLSLLIYEKFGHVYFDRKIFNYLGKDKFRVHGKGELFANPKVLKELIALVKEKGSEREFMDVLVYSDEKIEPQEVNFFWIGFIFIIIAVVGNGIALGLRFLREDNKG